MWYRAQPSFSITAGGGAPGTGIGIVPGITIPAGSIITVSPHFIVTNIPAGIGTTTNIIGIDIPGVFTPPLITTQTKIGGEGDKITQGIEGLRKKLCNF